VTGERVHALATPLITKSDGTKYGKTESGTIWLDKEMMSAYAFHQFWLNADDSDVIALLKYFTFRSREEIEELAALVAEKPAMRAAQRVLADDVTTLVHGPDETGRAKAAAAALFGGGSLDDLDASTLEAALREAPFVEVGAADPLPSYVDLLCETGLVASKGAARRTVAEGGAYANNVRITDIEQRPGPGDLLAGGWLLLRRGKRNLAGVKVA
jgi:tyrosyl-tRNA synthetase